MQRKKERPLKVSIQKKLLKEKQQLRKESLQLRKERPLKESLQERLLKEKQQLRKESLQLRKESLQLRKEGVNSKFGRVLPYGGTLTVVHCF